jgi:outer membrane lipoprotein-sorting protein
MTTGDTTMINIKAPFRAAGSFARASVVTSMVGMGLLMGGAGVALTTPALAQAAPGSISAAQEIANKFSSVKTLTGNFVQFGPRGDQTEGTFYIERPGKIRFNYNKPSPIRVISDGKSVVINNRKLDTWDLYPLSKTPLKLLLSDQIDLSGGKVKSVKQEPDMTTIVLGDKSIFGNSTITMMFDPKTNDLRQWTITDAQGLDTTVMITNVRTGVRFADDMFTIDYTRIAMKR